MPVDPERAQHQDDAGATPKKANQEAVMDTFPASDPVAQRGETGARAVPLGALLAEADEPVAIPADATPRSFGFPSKERAKLALEEVVRNLPLDRRFASVDGDEGGATLIVHARDGDGDRLAAMLARAGGEPR